MGRWNIIEIEVSRCIGRGSRYLITIIEEIDRGTGQCIRGIT